MTPEQLFDIRYTPELNIATAYLKWDSLKSVQSGGIATDLSKEDEAIAFAIGLMWQRHGQEIIDYICEYCTGIPR